MVRKKGSRNKGYWYRANRGWYVGTEPLKDASGNHIKSKDDKQAAEQAYHTLMANGEQPKPAGNGYTLRELCLDYLKDAKDKVRTQTYALRRRFLVDFCEGVAQSGKRIHKGYGDLPVNELIGLPTGGSGKAGKTPYRIPKRPYGLAVFARRT